MSEDHVIFDLEDAVILLHAAALEARRLDAMRFPANDGRGVKKGDPAVAAANRDIQHLMHLCDRGTTEVSAAYWRSRGFTDPLREAP